MCFSASASFIAGTALSAAGVATLQLPRRRSESFFAAIPLLFGVQQLTEGFVWLSLRDGTALPNHVFTQIYSVFSHVLWPIFVPFAVGRLETVAWRKKVLVGGQIAGAAVGAVLLYFMIKFPMTSRLHEQHIIYDSPHFFIRPVMALYLIATCGSSLFSGQRVIQVFGALLLAAFLAAYSFHVATLVSVWCFFAAVVSLTVYFYFRRRRSS